MLIAVFPVVSGLQTFMEVLDERKAKGLNDKTGAEASN